jgi:hypothetical protein
MTTDERPGLEIVLTFIQTGANFRQVKKFIYEELAALDAENVED